MCAPRLAVALILAVAAIVAPRAAAQDASDAASTIARAAAAAADTSRRSEHGALRDALGAVDRAGLDDSTWIDLHVTLAALDRSLDPVPSWTGDQRPLCDALAGLPVDLAHESGDAALRDLARRCAAIRLLPGAAPPDDTVCDVLRRHATALDEAATRLGAEGAPPAAADAAAQARRLAFDVTIAAGGAVPAGRARFEWELRRQHGLALTADQVVAEAAVARRDAHAALVALAEEVGNGRSWTDLVADERADRFEDGDELLAACRDAVAESVLAARASGLVSVPDHALALEVVAGGPDFEQAFARYIPGKRDAAGRHTARYLIAPVPKDLGGAARDAWLADFDRHWIRVISVHEGFPGHHLQFACAAQVPGSARALGYNSVFVEGWGFYAEGLMERAGFFPAPLTRLALRRMALWRALRASLAPGLHTGAVTPSDAVAVLTDEVGLSRRAAEREVRNYLAWPTQPLGYLIGRRRIEAMRAKYLEMNGADAEREFHDRLLGLGCIPLDLAAAVLLGRRAEYDATHP